MSAVLKALKKLEADNKNSVLLTPGSGRVSGNGPSKARRKGRRFIRSGLLAAACLILIAGAGGYLYLHMQAELSRWIPNRFLSRHPKASKAVSSTPPRSIPKPVPTGKGTQAKPSEKPARPQAAKNPPPNTAPPVRIPSSSQPVRPSAPGIPPSRTVSPVETKPRIPSLPQAPLRSPARRTVKKSAPPVAVAETEIFKGSDLELQAIAWSNQPAERLAVINGLILREGDSVEGYGIAEIQQEGVLVRRNSSTQKLVFTTN